MKIIFSDKRSVFELHVDGYLNPQGLCSLMRKHKLSTDAFVAMVLTNLEKSLCYTRLPDVNYFHQDHIFGPKRGPILDEMMKLVDSRITQLFKTHASFFDFVSCQDISIDRITCEDKQLQDYLNQQIAVVRKHTLYTSALAHQDSAALAFAKARFLQACLRIAFLLHGSPTEVHQVLKAALACGLHDDSIHHLHLAYLGHKRQEHKLRATLAQLISVSDFDKDEVEAGVHVVGDYVFLDPKIANFKVEIGVGFDPKELHTTCAPVEVDSYQLWRAWDEVNTGV